MAPLAPRRRGCEGSGSQRRHRDHLGALSWRLYGCSASTLPPVWWSSSPQHSRRGGSHTASRSRGRPRRGSSLLWRAPLYRLRWRHVAMRCGLVVHPHGVVTLDRSRNQLVPRLLRVVVDRSGRDRLLLRLPVGMTPDDVAAHSDAVGHAFGVDGTQVVSSPTGPGVARAAPTRPAPPSGPPRTPDRGGADRHPCRSW